MYTVDNITAGAVGILIGTSFCTKKKHSRDLNVEEYKARVTMG